MDGLAPEKQGSEQLLQSRIDRLLTDARDVLAWTAKWKAEYDWENLEVPLSRLSLHPTVVRMGSSKEITQQAVQEIKKDLEFHGQKPTDDTLIPLKDFVDFLKSLEATKQTDKLSVPCIRPILCPEPGQVPFKHDPVQRYADYAAEWHRNPPPGEKRHDKLRWQVRDYMTRVDLPQL